MLAAFKSYVMPYLVYLTVLWACWHGITKKAIIPIFVFSCSCLFFLRLGTQSMICHWGACV